jgi:mannose-6-phosphate isomerase-like protein (cupin superfamily)
MSLRITRDRLPGSPESRQFIGADHGGAPVSLFLVAAPRGAGPRLHRHPYPEIFVIESGRADFQIDGDRVAASGGDVLVAPAGSAHRFTNPGDDELRLTAIHTSARMTTEWLEP